MNPTNTYDIIILGGGMAGMTAALYAARANRKCVLLETNITGGLANSTYTIENFPSYVDVHGMDLMQRVREQIDHLGVYVEEVCEIESFDISGLQKKVQTDTGSYEAPTVIVATGREPISLDLPTACDQIHYCAICDGAAYKGKKVVVVGGGNSAFDEGLYLLQLGVEHLTILEEKSTFFAAESTQKSLFSYPNVTALTDTFVSDVQCNSGKLAAVIIEHKSTGKKEIIQAEGIFVFQGQSPRSQLFKDILMLDEYGYILANESMQTNVSGVFSAGDINAKQFRQLTTAAADGTIAALMADRYLRGM